MSLESLTHTDSGTERIPTSKEDWRDWISATATRDFAMQDPILDWLDLYGTEKGFRRDDAYPDYDPRTDFTEFVFAQGRRFEEAVVAYLQTLTTIETIGGERGDAHDLAKAEATFDAMRAGTPVIAQAVLRDAEHQTYGLPDLLVRSDVLERLFRGTLAGNEFGITASDLGAKEWHYRVVDIKFRGLDLLKNGELNNARSAAAYKLQHLATVTDAPAAATPVWAAALAAVDACARVAADLRAGAPCTTAVATTRDGRVSACGHAASVHVDGLRLGCANTAAFEPDCVAPRGPPRWRVAHPFQEDPAPDP